MLRILYQFWIENARVKNGSPALAEEPDGSKFVRAETAEVAVTVRPVVDDGTERFYGIRFLLDLEDLVVLDGSEVIREGIVLAVGTGALALVEARAAKVCRGAAVRAAMPHQ